MPSAQTLILNPGGSLSLSTGICAAGVGAGGAGTGASGEVASSGGRPCCQAGGGAGCCAWAGTSHDVMAPSTNTVNVINMRLMWVLLREGWVCLVRS